MQATIDMSKQEQVIPHTFLGTQSGYTSDLVDPVVMQTQLEFENVMLNNKFDPTLHKIDWDKHTLILIYYIKGSQDDVFGIRKVLKIADDKLKIDLCCFPLLKAYSKASLDGEWMLVNIDKMTNLTPKNI